MVICKWYFGSDGYSVGFDMAMNKSNILYLYDIDIGYLGVSKVEEELAERAAAEAATTSPSLPRPLLMHTLHCNALQPKCNPLLSMHYTWLECNKRAS